MCSKKCNTCGIDKEDNCFSKKYKTKDGIQKYQPICKDCAKLYQIEYKIKNRDIVIQKSRINYKNNREKYLEQKKEYYKENKQQILEYKVEYRNRDGKKELAREYSKQYQKENKEKYYSYRRRNPHIIAWRNILYRALRYLGKEKEFSTVDMLGYSANDLKIHMEKQFKEGMTWNNHGEWEIDHIRPLTSFDTQTDACVVNALSNLQPLWKEENIKKYNYI
jgi:hypothetical protein